MSQPIGFTKQYLSEDDLTFLDDVPWNQMEAFKEMMDSSIPTAIQKWYLSNPRGVKSFAPYQFEEVLGYFRYLLALELSRD